MTPGPNVQMKWSDGHYKTRFGSLTDYPVPETQFSGLTVHSFIQQFIVSYLGEFFLFLRKLVRNADFSDN